MTLFRYTILGGGGFLLTLAYIGWLSFDLEHATAPWAMVTVPLVGICLLIAADHFLHFCYFGHRVEFQLAHYSPPPICPFTGEAASVPKNLLCRLDPYSPVPAFAIYNLPILISPEAAERLPQNDLGKIPGLFLARFTEKKAVLYIRDRRYYSAFLAANERSLIEIDETSQSSLKQVRFLFHILGMIILGLMTVLAVAHFLTVIKPR